MTIEELIARLEQLAQIECNEPDGHIDADGLLLDYINDPRVTAAYVSIEKWYS